MGDWGVLELEGDPTPGDPDAVREMAVRLRGQAELAEANTARLRAIGSSTPSASRHTGCVRI
ncbi:hypothetical protein [Frankia sp. Cr1]|uniref:hypothetical protein n=1 Tax=Frankia sp. Cr1 TaxID=3073931 RepID=UPI002AD29B98|nr:hypothetical protein [Frankia sp. Cr1]